MDRKPGSRPPRDSPDRREGLGRAIQSLRAERGLKRQELAERAGLSYAYLAEIENGKKEPSTKVLAALAAALGIRLPELMEVAESLQDLAEATEDAPTKLEPEQALEPSPMMAGRLASPRTSWFHRPTEPAEEPMATEYLRSAARGGAEVRSRTDLLDELQQLASRLPPEDLERLLDLARRLGK